MRPTDTPARAPSLGVWTDMFTFFCFSASFSCAWESARADGGAEKLVGGQGREGKKEGNQMN